MEQLSTTFLLIISISLQKAKGFTWTSNPILNSTCEGRSIFMVWDYTLVTGETVFLTEWKKSNGAGGVIMVGDYDGNTLTEASSYNGRLKNIGNAGLEIKSSTLLDGGIYYAYAYSGSSVYTASATVSVYMSPTTSCIPRKENTDNRLMCFIPDGCRVKEDSKAYWYINNVKYEDAYICTSTNFGKTYECCAEGSAIDTCTSRKLCVTATCPAMVQTAAEADDGDYDDDD